MILVYKRNFGIFAYIRLYLGFILTACARAILFIMASQQRSIKDFFKITECTNPKPSILPQECDDTVKKANAEVRKVLEVKANLKRGTYNTLDPEQKTRIGRYAAEEFGNTKCATKVGNIRTTREIGQLI